MCDVHGADPVYPPSLYRAVSYASTLGVPVYILENGMPCAQDDDRRKDWIDGCLAEARTPSSAVQTPEMGRFSGTFTSVWKGLTLSRLCTIQF